MLCLLTTMVMAQNTSAVKGTIRDKDTKQPIVGVKVTILSTKTTTLKFELITDKQGTVLKKGIIPGVYQIMYEKNGYIPASATTRLPVGDEQDISVELEPVKDALTPGMKALKEGINLISAGKFGEAIPVLEGGVAVDANNSMIYFYRGFAREKTGKTEEALADYLKAVELKADFELALASAAKLYARKGNLDQAVALYGKADALGTKDTTTLYNYGVCLVNLGRNVDAKTIFEKVLTIDPENADSIYEWGVISIGLGDITKAKELLQKYVSLEPDNPKAQTAKEILKSL